MFAVILGSTVVAAFVTAIFTRKSYEDSVSLKYITEERASWREKVKELVSELSEAVHLPTLNRERIKKVRKISSYLKLSLNPNPKEILDSKIIKCLEQLCIDPRYSKVKEIEKLTSLLLKYDWERAKREAKGSISPLVLILICTSLIWIIFSYILKDTGVYKFVQNIPLLAGSYNEITFSILFSVTFFCVLVIFNDMEWKCRVLPVSKTNSIMKCVVNKIRG